MQIIAAGQFNLIFLKSLSVRQFKNIKRDIKENLFQEEDLNLKTRSSGEEMANSSMGELIFFMRGNKVKSKRSLEIVRSKIRDEFQKELDRPRRKRFVLNCVLL